MKPLPIAATDQDGVRGLAVAGEIDLATSPQFAAALARAPTPDATSVLDLSAVTFMDTQGLHALVTAQRNSLTLLAVPDSYCRTGGVDPGFEYARLRALRSGIYGCFTRRADALFDLCDAMVCSTVPVCSPVGLSVEPEFRRRHAMVQVRGAGGDRILPGWPVSILVGLSWGACSWVDPLDARRIAPGGDHTDVLIAQVQALVADLKATGRCGPGAAWPLVMFDSGYPVTLIAHAFEDSGAQVLGRVRADRVFYFPPAPSEPGRGRPAVPLHHSACLNVTIRADSDRNGPIRHEAHRSLEPRLRAHQRRIRLRGAAHRGLGVSRNGVTRERSEGHESPETP
jgi:hypothetical protein